MRYAYKQLLMHFHVNMAKHKKKQDICISCYTIIRWSLFSTCVIHAIKFYKKKRKFSKSLEWYSYDHNQSFYG